MALDIHITTKNKEIIHIAMSERLHSKIFSNLVRWSSFKRLRKIKDYYRADCIFTGADAVFFIEELLQALHELKVDPQELHSSFNSTKGENALNIRITSD